MGQKVHPTGIRLGVVKDHNSVWYADSKSYASQLVTDLEVREYILKRLDAASVSRVVIERPAQTARVTIHTARPGIVIGKKGEDVESLRQELSGRMGVPVHITIEEIRKPDMDARLVAQNVAQQLERRVMFRRAMKRVVQNAMRQGAEGIKVQVSGRLGGAEIARTEWYREGRVPLHTLRADIDYATYEAHTTYALKATGRGRITARQIEAARRTMTRHIKRGGIIWIRFFPDKPITGKPLEVRQGKGKGNVEYWVAQIQPGRVLYEVEGVSEELAREAFALAAAKLPVQTTFVKRSVM